MARPQPDRRFGAQTPRCPESDRSYAALGDIVALEAEFAPTDHGTQWPLPADSGRYQVTG
jgi:hypothetical protein